MKKQMKVLTIEAAFELPDGFKGDVPDALRLLADYLETADRPLPPPGPGGRAFCPTIWTEFRAMPAEHRACIAASVTEHPQRIQEPPAAAEKSM